ncbi:Tlr1610 protein [Candidatus Moduliflexus flocculans]|uniref:Tlr1610 protein n=1 Tax=Candidatus Moduliflexus flocculans TaxID=1499966 RepID=A0A0S6VPR4_9BACT|nr:Tlr1610 protein [Candidatus Moduliflexus flocculans]
MATFQSIFKGVFSIFAKAIFAIISFFVMLMLFSLLFIGLGVGIGAKMGGGALTELSEQAKSNYAYISGDEESANRLLRIPIQGVILGTMPSNFPMFLADNLTFGYDVQEQLERAAEDESIKGVFLHIQTPGGTIFGSYAIAEAITNFRETTNKPVLAYIEGLAASGGVMAMVTANEIYADYGSLIGSIGVIGPQLLYYNQPMAFDGGLFGDGITTKGGIEQTILFAGKGKDLGNPFRKISKEELENWQRGLETEYAQFVGHVAKTRNIDESIIRDQMGAQLFDNQTAEGYGLINGTLNQNAALDKLAELAGVSGDYQLVRPVRRSGQLFAQLLEGWTRLSNNSVELERFRQQAIQAQVCQKTAHLSLVYYGDLSALCK